MARRSAAPLQQLELLQVGGKSAPCVPGIRTAVAEWRASDYKGVTDTTRLLLNYWFRNDHRLRNGQFFRYHDSQREAIETLIYLFEVAQVRRQKSLLERYAAGNPNLRLLQFDDFARYCIKMATGSGKTKVMALAIAWQYFNAAAEARDDFARTFLILAPNVIVFERLRHDFAGGRIFRDDPIIPPEREIYWDFDCYVRGEPERSASSGALYLTNIQQLYQRAGNAEDDEPDVMTAMLGAKPPAKKVEIEDFEQRIAARDAPCMVLNDEAHHTHAEDSEWNNVIRRLHQAVPSGLAAQLDFSATPRFNKGSLFTWTVYDYSLKQAILDGIVKRPVKGITTGIQEQPSNIASVRYKAYLTAAVERWREYREQLAPLSHKPLLFVMMNDTKEADDVADYLRSAYPAEFGGENLLVIHTDNSGDVSKKDLDAARKVAREVDDVESPVNAIVSVLMLREGWDVQNVTVIVGLRPYTSKANILPEQTIGRGLRLMFRNYGTTYVERVDVIGTKKFIELVETLEKDEELELDTFEVGKDKLIIVHIMPDPAKLERDIVVPRLSAILARKKTLAEEIASIDIQSLSCPRLPKKDDDPSAQSFHYDGYDIITLQKFVERDYQIPEPQTAQEVISFYAKRIAQDVKLPSQFAALVPKVREFLATRAFGEPVDLDTPAMIKAISSNVAHYVTVTTFAHALKSLVIEPLTPELLDSGRKLSDTPPFPYSRPTISAAKCVFNLVPCDNEFERHFAEFLEQAPEVAAFAKLPSQFGFAIEYTDNASNLRYYEPDFIVRTDDGNHYLIETKGREDIDVAHKDRSAVIWCENATLLTGTSWQYLKIPQMAFQKLQPNMFSDLLVFKPSLS